MKFKVKTEKGTSYLDIPCHEKELAEFCENAGIENNNKAMVTLEDDFFKTRANILLSGMTVNIDKLNYLAKRMDSLDNKEYLTFYAVAQGKGMKNLNDLINLSFNIHCYSLVSDFSNPEKVGRELFLTTEEAVRPRALEELNGAKYLASVMAENPHPMITSYGVVYKNSNPFEEVFDGTHFPQYEWENNMGTVELKKGATYEYLYLPFEETELTKALERLGATSLDACSFSFESEWFHEAMEAVVGDFEENSQERLDCINHLAEKIKEIGTKEMPFINKLMIDLSPHTIQDMDTIFDSAYEFELFDDIHTAEDYGRYMISDSGHFEYDDNLEEYIDFERYGSDRLMRENGAFTLSGYLLYHGCNQSLSEMLSEVGIEIEQAKTQTLKLYMPLRATSYYEENFYGDMEQTDDEVEIDSHDLVEFEDEIMEAIEENNFPEESRRGLMEYYGKNDSVNAKVKRYDFSVEVVDGKLMGVVTAQLNAPLDGEELKKLKQTVEGQCSDGWGEGFEQRDITCGDRDINVSFWNSSKNWSLQTAEELGIEDHAYTMEMRGM